MKIFRRIFLALVLLFVAASASASNEPSRLVIELTDGTSQSFVLAEKPVVTFDSEHVYVNSSEFAATFSNVLRCYFPDDASIGTSVAEVQAELKPTFSFQYQDGRTVVISGDEKLKSVAVYTISGMKCNALVDRQTSQTVVHLDDLPSDFYIIRANNHSFKLYKR